MKRTVTVVETMTYFIEVDADPSLDAYDVEVLAMTEWNADHGRTPDDYEVEFFAKDEA